jgi:mono/diheme cytochrome c family protein
MLRLIPIAVVLLASVTFAAEAPHALPAPAGHPVDFVKEIKPLFEASCIQCHAVGKDKGGFSLETRAAMLKGGDDGDQVVLGKSGDSNIVKLVAGVDPDEVMPKKGTKWTPQQVALLRAWIDQGANWDSKVTFAKPEPLNLKPRAVALPAGKAAQPVDRLLASYFAAKGVTPPPGVDDRAYCRRVYLDAIGLLPMAGQLNAFVADTAPDKRERLVRKLLDDRRGYADHWLTFWNDLLRNDYKGAGFIDGGRRQITGWLYAALVDNKPYDQFVAQLVDPTKMSEGFSRGIVWRGSVNASQLPPVQAAQNISQVFLGVNLKCASCHDSFVSNFTLADAYGMAAIYSDTTLELIHCDKSTGKVAAPRFLYPQVGTIDPNAPRPQRLSTLAKLITSSQDGRLSRTIVNRLWQRLLGRGLVESVDDMEKPAWDADLLDWLADDLVAHDYDLKHTIETILTSQAYQLPSVDPNPQAKGEYVFVGPQPRRLTAEQYADAISSLTDDWGRMPSTINVDFTSGNLIGPIKMPLWVWTDEPVDVGTKRLHELDDKKKKIHKQIDTLQKQLDDLDGEDAKPAKAKKADAADPDKDPDRKKDPAEKFATHLVVFRKHFTLDRLPDEAYAALAASQGYSISVNGKGVRGVVSDGERRGRIAVFDVRPQLVVGDNVIAIAVNSHTDKSLNDDEFKQYPMSRHHVNAVSGMAFYLRSRFADGSFTELTTDASWHVHRAPEGKWKRAKYDDAGWAAAVPLAGGATPVDEGPGLPPITRHDFANEPIELSASLIRAAVSTAAQPGHIRASLRAADALQTALDRPSREQVITERSTAPSTLQALELTNGHTLDAELRKAAAKLAPAATADPKAWVRDVYLHALGREPDEQEMSESLQMLNWPVLPDAAADYLWAITQLPEFQFVN